MDVLNEYPDLRDALGQHCVVDGVTKGVDEIKRPAEGAKDNDRIGIDTGRLWQDLNRIIERFHHE